MDDMIARQVSWIKGGEESLALVSLNPQKMRRLEQIYSPNGSSFSTPEKLIANQCFLSFSGFYYQDGDANIPQLMEDAGDKVVSSLAQGKELTEEEASEAHSLVADILVKFARAWLNDESIEAPRLISSEEKKAFYEAGNLSSKQLENRWHSCPESRFVKIAQRDGLYCARCAKKRTALSVIHAHHPWFGGSCDLSNLLLCCADCSARHRTVARILARCSFISENYHGEVARRAKREARRKEIWSYQTTRDRAEREYSAFYIAPKTAGADSLRQWEWQQIIVFQEGRCNACGAEGELTMDHILAQKHGGVHDRSNFQGLCASCNSAKRDQPWSEFLAKRGFRQQYDLARLWADLEFDMDELSA